ncbi:MAG: universal stress protein [Verrucomicrobiaceae bacterium]
MTIPQDWKKIVVPTDFSDHSNLALKAAASLGHRTGASVLLLHVTEPAYEGLRIQTEELHECMTRAAEGQLEKLAGEHFPGSPHVSFVVKEGRPADVICKTAAEVQADAIIIPTHGHSGLANVLLGSVTEKVVRHAPCSVLVVRK